MQFDLGEGGTIRVSASTSAKKNHGDYQSQDAYSGLSMEVTFDPNDSPEEVIAKAEDLWAQLKAATDAMVASALGFEIGDDGGLEMKAPPAKTQKSNGTQRRQNATPRRQEAAARGDFDVNDYWSNIEKKLNGDYAPTAADFKHKVTKRPVWLIDKAGNADYELAAKFGVDEATVDELVAIR